MIEIDTIDKNNAKKLRDVIQNALNELPVNGVKFHIGNCSFVKGHNATFKLEVAKESPDGFLHTPEAMEWEYYAPLYNLPKDAVGKMITVFATNKPERIQILGFKSRSTRYPIIAKRMRDGKIFKYTLNTIRNAFSFQNETNT